MAYASINGTTYGVAIGSSRGRRIQIENRTPVLDGSLNVDRIAVRSERTVEFIKTAAGAPLTIAQAESLMDALCNGAVTVAGDFGTFTAAARDVGHRDEIIEGVTKRFVTATLEETEV